MYCLVYNRRTQGAVNSDKSRTAGYKKLAEKNCILFGLMDFTLFQKKCFELQSIIFGISIAVE
jgi:hypothetical protein